MTFFAHRKRYIFKKRLFVLLQMVLVLFVFSACSSSATGVAEDKNNAPFSPTQDNYVLEGRYDDVEYYIEYPHFNMPEVDGELFLWANDVIRTHATSPEGADQPPGCTINIGYSKAFLTESILCFKQTGSVVCRASATASDVPPAANETGEVVKLFFVDLESMRIYALPDILKGLEHNENAALGNAIGADAHFNDLTFISDVENADGGISFSLVDSGEVITLTAPDVRNALLNGDNPQQEAVTEPTFAPERKIIALTFDDGPSQVTDTVLDTLEYYGVKATFFIVGRDADYYRDTLIRMNEMGMEMGNHTWTHPNLTKIKKRAIESQFESTQQLLEGIIGSAPTLARAPYGSIDYRVQDVCKKMGLSLINWSIDPWDWDKRDAAAIYADVMAHAHDGGIILLHDLYEETALAAQYLIPALLEQGYEFVTVSELFEAYGPEIEAGSVYRKAG